MRKQKRPSESRTEMNMIIRPADANSIGTCFGGVLMQWMDMAASICARRHCNVQVNTVSAEHIQFRRALNIGDVAHIVATVVRAFRTSMDLKVQVFSEHTFEGTSELAATAHFIFIGLDERKKPTVVPDLMPMTKEEKLLWQDAGERRKRQRKIDE